jgi:glyceraldehyde 3-phosphate dehydrogenase
MSPKRVGINGFGRIGRLAMRAAWDWPQFDFVHVNETAGTIESAAHLLEFDSIHGRWKRDIRTETGGLSVDGEFISLSQQDGPGRPPWDELGVEVIIEATGQFRTEESLQPFFEKGVEKVVLAAPVRGARNHSIDIVIGVNDDAYRPRVHRIITAASCTTNCLAPIVQVLDDGLGIDRGSITTLHDMTNTQVPVDRAHKDLRRARAAGVSLIPTSTGSAAAIGVIFPHLEGKLDGIAVRVPLLNASLTDCVFEVGRPTTVYEVNELLSDAASDPMEGILGYEERPLVSVDYRTDPRSGVVDALSTRVTDQTQVKVLAWYDNEWGYANRLSELTRSVASSIDGD